MKIVDIIKMSIGSLANRRLRSWLTILGIIIGVAAVVGLVSIGTGMQKTITEQLSGLGGNIIFITPGHTKANPFEHQGFGGGLVTGGTISGNLTENDLRFIKSIPGIFVATGMLSRSATVRYIAETANINTQGVEPGIAKVFSTVALDEGRYILSGDDQSAVIGHNVAKELFKNDVKINDPLFINGQSFRIVGILKQSGQMAQTDNLLILPLAAARRVFSDFPKDQFSAIVLKVSEGADVKEVAEQVEKRLLLSHHVTAETPDFTVLTSQSVLETIGQIISTITLFLGGIAAISLLVGGIGIANTMFMSVMERTRQIGILKALGATNGDVMKLFLAESGILGLVGGIFGVLLGYLFSVALSHVKFFGGSEGFTTSVPSWLALFAIGFAIFIGILSGLLPARKAAKLQPVEALRYE